MGEEARVRWTLDGVKTVALRQQERVGVAAGRLRADRAGTAELYGMWVDPRFRGAGVAAMLAQDVMAWARERGTDGPSRSTLLRRERDGGVRSLWDDVDPSTRTNVTNAMQGEALANVMYRAYAKQADRENLPDVAALYRRTAHTELREHFTEQAKLIGLVGDNAANLRGSTSGETYEATTMY